MAKRIIIGDSEVTIPNITLGILPLLGLAVAFWLSAGFGHTHDTR